jgi:hypothetical protein
MRDPAEEGRAGETIDDGPAFVRSHMSIWTSVIVPAAV